MCAFRAHSRNCEKGLLASSCLSLRPSVRLEQLGSHWADIYEIWCLNIFRKSIEKNPSFIRITFTLHEDQQTFLIISRSMLLRLTNISDKFVEKIKTHILCLVTFFWFENRAFYEITWINIVQPDRPQMTIWRMRIACWIPKAIDTRSLFFHRNNGCMNAPQCYVIRTSPVF